MFKDTFKLDPGLRKPPTTALTTPVQEVDTEWFLLSSSMYDMV